VLRIASSVLHILPQTTEAPYTGTPAALVIGRKAAQERFSEESFRKLRQFNFKPETRFSKALPQIPTQFPELAAYTKPGLTRGTKLL